MAVLAAEVPTPAVAVALVVAPTLRLVLPASGPYPVVVRASPAAVPRPED
jgi:hypothetical protein